MYTCDFIYYMYSMLLWIHLTLSIFLWFHSFYAFIHDDTGLYACSKGCPSNEVVRIRLDNSAKIQADLEQLRGDYILNEKSQMFVMISMATNEMIRLVVMYPDVWFMDYIG